jgi:hypothetical protein
VRHVRKSAFPRRQLSPSQRAEFIADKLEQAGLRLPSPLEGISYQCCPQCGPSRRKKYKQKKRCLRVTIDSERVMWVCCHCGFKGGRRFENAGRVSLKHKNNNTYHRNLQERLRREHGVRPQSESNNQTEPWKLEGISERTWYRRQAAARLSLSTPASQIAAPTSMPLDGRTLRPHMMEAEGSIHKKEESESLVDRDSV